MKTQPITDLAPDPANPRRMTEEASAGLARSTERFGDLSGIVFNRTTGQLVSGHQRIAALKAAGAKVVKVDGDWGYIVHPKTKERFPVRFVDWTPEEQRIANVTANNANIMGTWEPLVLEQLEALKLDVDFGTLQLDALQAQQWEAQPEPEPSGGNCDPDDVPEPPAEPISKRGDLWLLGDHRLMCGDSTCVEDVRRLMAGERATMIHADPPYGMGKENDGIAGDNQYGVKLDAFQMAWWRAWRASVADNGSAYIWGVAEDLWRLWYCGCLRESERLTLRNEVVWAKGASAQGQGSDSHRMFPSATERCLFFMLGEQGFNINADNYWEGWEPVRSYLAKNCETMGWGPQDVSRITGTASMFSRWFTRSQFCFITEENYRKLQAAAKGDGFKREFDDLKREFYSTRAYFDNTHENMTDVWEFPPVRGEERHGHATPKPVDMVARAIKSSSKARDVVGVPFSGSGSDIIAAEMHERRCFACELEPRFCDVIVARWEKFTGRQATLER